MKISFSLRAFVVYFLILATLSWFILDKAIERMNVALRQSAESVLVDTANLLATSLEQEFEDQTLDTWEISQLFSKAYQREINARIYQVYKEKIDTEVYVTDRQGVVVYDSTGMHTGEDYSNWRDVRLTLEGAYGARTSYRDELKTEPEDPKIMVIAAPIRYEGTVVGVVSVVKPIQSLEQFLLDESNALKRYAIGLLFVAMVLGYLVSHGFTASIGRLANYANDMAAGKKVPTPTFLDKRFARLSAAISRMRQEIDGKEYVEQYVHSLTHELKTPLTAIQAASELLDENPPAAERARFLDNIRTSNQRMSRLVDRMLSLARLEGTPSVQTPTAFNLLDSIQLLLAERESIVRERKISINVDHAPTSDPSAGPEWEAFGDPLLIQQAIANLLDNALDFCLVGGWIRIRLATAVANPLSDIAGRQGYMVSIANQGDPLDSFVLERAFDRFFSMPRETGTGRNTKSTGLGLSFVREIMKLHQGNAVIANEDGAVVVSLWWPEPQSG